MAAGWAYSFMLVTALTAPTSEFIVPVNGSEIFPTDTLCMEALERMIVFYTVKGMYIKGKGLTADGEIVEGPEHGGICKPKDKFFPVDER